MPAFIPFTTSKHFRNSLLFAAVFGVVMLVAFSPVFSQNVTVAHATHAYACATVNGSNTTCDLARYSDAACTVGGPGCISTGPGTETCVPIEQCNRAFDTTGLTQAPEIIGGIVMEGLLDALIRILEFLNNMLRLLVGLVARLLDSAILISLAGLSGINAITIGWGITRDVANIFFIFILLIIAIATILRLESYGAKQLLPKLIIVALLINFSLVIATTIVDSSNILALTFISRITPVSDKLATILRINKITETTAPPSATDINWQAVTSTGYPAGIGVLNQAFTADEEVMNPTPVLQNEPNEQVIQFFWQATILILQLTLIFVFVALGVMLLVRSVALIIIFVLAPLGFLAAILPATRGYANKWWHKLFEWSFFFPASAFMIYLAIAYGAQMSQYLEGNFFNMGMLFNYFATVAILIGSLIVAKQMGIVGAAAAIGIGVGIAKSARGYAGRATLRYGVGPAGAVAGFIPQQLGRIPYVGKPLKYALAPFTAAGSAMQRAGARVKEQRYADIKKRVTESESANRATLDSLPSAKSQQEFRDAVIDKGHAKILRPRELQQDVERFKREKDFNKLRKIYAYDPSLAAMGEQTEERQKAAISQAAQGLSVDDIRSKTNAGVIKNAFVADAMLLNYGSQKLEASAEAFGTDIGPALEGAFDRLVAAKKVEMAAAGKVFATEADEQTAAEEEAVKHLSKQNADVLKFANRNQTINLSSTLGNKVRSITNKINQAAEKEEVDTFEESEKRHAVQQLRARLKATGKIPTPAEIAAEEADAIAAITKKEQDSVKRRAKKIET